MIEVNLLPGGRKRAARARSVSFALPKMGGLPQDRWVLGSAVVVIAALVVMGWLYLGVRSDREETQVALDEAIQDSVRFADLIARTNLLTARRDSIAEKVGIIQEIDQERYVWAHLLDEVARALPDYTWLTALTQVSTDPVRIRLEGQAGNNFALTVFMEQLEASAFLQGVDLIESAQSVTPDQQVVSAFQLEVNYAQPPMEFLQTVPLFEGSVSTQTEAVPADTTGAPQGAGEG